MDRKLIHSVFENVAARWPENIAIHEEGKTLTYRQLNTAANELAYIFEQLGLQKGFVVAVMTEPGVSLVTALIAIFRAGGIYLPLGTALPENRMSLMLGECNPEILLVDDEGLAIFDRCVSAQYANWKYLLVAGKAGDIQVFRNMAGERQRMDTIMEVPAALTNFPLCSYPDDGNYIFYTSGSTGTPKAILGCHKSLAHFIDWEAGEFNIDSSCRVAQLIHVTFDASLRDIFLPLCTGGTLFIPPPEVRSDMLKLIYWLDEKQITLIHYVPSLFRLLLREMGRMTPQPGRFPHLKYVLLAGEMLYVKDIRQWRELAGNHAEIVNLYGPTETTMVKTFHRIGDVPQDDKQRIPAGKAISKTMVAVVNDNVACDVNEIGEVYIKTPFVTKGYPFDPALNKTVFVQNPLSTDSGDIVYRTGDLGKILVNGDIEILGRKDTQVKIHGVRVDLNEVEKAVNSLEWTEQVLVLSKEDDEHYVRLICYYTGTNREPEDFLHALQKLLVPVALPSFFVHLDTFPLTINGKIDRRSLPQPAVLLVSDVQYEPVNTETETVLEQIWKDILGVDRIGRKVSFFGIGGNSLKAIQMISRIFRAYDVVIQVKDIFNSPAIADLALVVEKSVIRKKYGKIVPLEPQPYYELSHAQKRLWVLSRFEQARSAYNIHQTYVLEGQPDIAALEKALHTLITRHEILRTRFTVVNGLPVQIADQPVGSAFGIRILDYRQEENKQEKVGSALYELAEQPFDLENDWLIRVTLVREDDNRQLLMFVIHHIICDAWSLELLVNDVLRLYGSFVRKEEVNLPPLAIQYKDYAAWQNRQLSGELLEEHRTYWLQQLGGTLPVLQLPCDYQRPVNKTFNGDAITVMLSAETGRRLNELSQQQESSLFMTLLSVVYLLLHKYSGQEDIVIGAPVAGREQVELENQVGFYINNLVLRAQPDPEDTFTALLKKVKALVLDAFAHQVYPFDMLVEELQQERDTSRSPLFDVAVVFPHTGIADRAETLYQLSVSEYDNGFRSSPLDIRMIFVEKPEGLSVTFEYNTDIFSPQTIEGMLSHFSTLTDSVLDAPELPLYRLTYLGAAEEQLWPGITGGAASVGNNGLLHDSFEREARVMPDAIAVITPAQKFTYREVNDMADRLAFHLRSVHGIKPGEMVGVMVYTSERAIIAILAILKAGGAYVPVDPELPAARKAFIFNDTKMQLLLTDAAVMGDVTEYYKGQLFALDLQQEGLEITGEMLLPAVSASDLAYVIYTSGSTGQPKGVMVEHRNAVNTFCEQVRRFGVTRDDRVLQFASLSFDASVSEIFMAFFAGAALVLPDRRLIYDTSGFVAHLAQQGVTNVTFPPSFLSTLPLADLSFLKTIITAGEMANSEDLHFCSTFARCFNAYGPTECAVCVTIHEVTKDDGYQKTVPVGTPLAGTGVYLLDKFLQPVGRGIIGEICVSGAGLARGYLHQPELTAAAFIENPLKPGERLYRTGDMGKWLSDGNLMYTGRRDAQVKIHGYRIELNEITAVLSAHPAVRNAVLTVKDRKDNDKQLIAYYISDDGNGVPGLKQWLGEYLPAYMIPAYLIAVPAFPLNINGKTDFRLLPDPDAIQSPITYVAPQNDIQRRIQAVWQQVLGRENIGIDDNFFEVGGHSLKATQILSHLQEAFRTRLDLGQFFVRPTIAAMAEMLEQTGTQPALHPIPLGEQDYYELSHSQRRLWILSQFEEGRQVYTLSDVVRIEGKLDRQLLDKALTAVINRHEILRTTFHVADALPRQKVHLPGSMPFRAGYTDLKDVADRQLQAEQLINTFKAQVFDPEKGPLLNVHLIQLEEKDWLLLFAIHHIIADEWSMAVLVREVMCCYREFSDGREVTLPALDIQYKDFAAWQQQRINENEDAKRYWHSQFAIPAPVLELPSYSRRPEIKTYKGNSRQLLLEETWSSGLAIMARQHGASIFMTLMASVYAFLHRYSGQQDIVIGAPVSLRNDTTLQTQIGLYLNTLAIRMTDVGGQPFATLLNEVKQQITAAFCHQEYPFDQLVEELQVERDLSRSPLFDVMVVLHDEELEENAIPRADGMVVTPVRSGMLSTKFDLTFNFRNTGKAFLIDLEYNTDIYSANWIQQMLEHYHRLLEELLSSPSTAVNELPYLSAAEQQQLVYGNNPSLTAYPETGSLPSLFAAQAGATPDAIAFSFEGLSLSYRELDERSNQLGHYLREQAGVKKGELVCVLMDRSAHMMVALLGIHKAGAAYVPIDIHYPAERIRYILTDTGSRCLLADDLSLVRQHGLSAAHVITLADLPAVSRCAVSALLPYAGAEELAYVLYTSGSTGVPKGVMVRHGGVVNRLHWMWEAYGFDNTDIILQKTPYVFDVSVWELFMPLCFGARLVMCRHEVIYDPVELAAHCERYGITAIHFVPGMLHVFLQTLTASDQERLRTLRRVIASGEALSSSTVGLWYAHSSAPLYNLYGPTEASIDVTHHHTVTGEEPVPIGRPVANMRLYILDECCRLAGEGIWGQIGIAGIGLATGYLNQPELSADRFREIEVVPGLRERIYLSGDKGRWLPGGIIAYGGRLDSQVKLRGHRIELKEIESVLQQYEGIVTAVAALKEDKTGEAVLIAYIVSDRETDTAALHGYLSQYLPGYMLPSGYVQLERIPFNANGKIDYKALPLPEQIGLDNGDNYTPPSNETEEKLVAVWEVVLNRKGISVERSFFDIGGTSMKLIAVYQRLLPEYPGLRVTDLFKYTNIRALCTFLDAGKEVQVLEVIEV